MGGGSREQGGREQGARGEGAGSRDPPFHPPFLNLVFNISESRFEGYPARANATRFLNFVFNIFESRFEGYPTGANATRFLNLVFNIAESRFEGYPARANATRFLNRFDGYPARRHYCRVGNTKSVHVHCHNILCVPVHKSFTKHKNPVEYYAHLPCPSMLVSTVTAFCFDAICMA